MSPRPAPLEGLKVLDLSQNLPGPYASYLLASWGADVIKLEPPRGDTARATRPLFDMLNRSKRSVVLDLRAEASAAARDALLGWADVILEGFRPGVAERLGVAYAQAQAVNSKVVYCSISAFGQDGPRHLDPGHDLNLQALTGVSSLEGDPGGPQYAMLPVADLSSSLLAVASISAAVASRATTGEGRYLDVAMADGALSWANLWGVGVNPAAAARKIARKRGGSALELTMTPVLHTLSKLRLYALPHYGVFRCRDGKTLALGIVDENKFWRAAVKALGLPSRLGKLPVALRMATGPMVRPLVAARLRTKDRAEWLRILRAVDVPVTAVLTPAEAVDEPQFRHRGMIDERGWVKAPLPDARILNEPAPKLGEHTEAVLTELGVTELP